MVVGRIRAVGEPRVYGPLIALAALLSLLLLTKNEFYLNLYFMIFMFAGLSSAWNIIGGFGGQLSLGHSAFYGLGSYTCGLLFVKYGVPPLLGLMASMGLSLVLALIIGYPCFRLKGPFFTLATIAMAEVLLLLAVYFKGLTAGSEGLSIAFKPSLVNLCFESKIPYAVEAFCYMLFALGVSLRVKKSRLGYQLVALRDEDQAAESLGVNTSRAKMTGLIISGGLTALGGGLFAQYVLFLEPHSEFSLNTSVNLALTSMVGGLGTVVGPAIGSFLLIPLQEFLRVWLGTSFQGLYFVIYGALLILVVMFMPKGIHEFFSGPYQRLQRSLPVFGPGIADKDKAHRGMGTEARISRIEMTRQPESLPLIEAKNISKRFGGLLAISGLSFSVNKGEIFGIIGPNGAGKSTLFNVLSGVYRQDAGTVKFKGKDLAGIHKSHLVCRLGIGRTFQLVKPFENITVLENVMVGAFNQQPKSSQASRLALEVLDFVGMLDKKDALGHTLTLGDKKRLELARALATGPEVLLLDEVMAGLTSYEIGEAVELIKKIRDQGLTVLVVEHVMQAIMSLSDRLMVLAETKKIMEGSPSEVIHDQRVIKAYLGDGYESA
jgi:branched-chain amino acid transport system ATP-binding protein/branched-chain amino acid transport system permease protein